MDSFDNGIGGRILGGDQLGLDAGIHQAELKFGTDEFGAAIMYTANGTWVLGEIGILEGMPGFVSLLGFNALDFKEVSNGFNAREHLEIHGLFVDRNLPWADRVHVDIIPRSEYGVARSKMTVGQFTGFILGTGFTGIDLLTDFGTEAGMMKMMADSIFEVFHAFGMDGGSVVPGNEVGKHGISEGDFPGLTGVKTN